MHLLQSNTKNEIMILQSRMSHIEKLIEGIYNSVESTVDYPIYSEIYVPNNFLNQKDFYKSSSVSLKTPTDIWNKVLEYIKVFFIYIIRTRNTMMHIVGS